MPKRSFLDGPPFKLSSAQELEVVQLHKHKKIAEIAVQFGVSSGTILRILHRHSALRPRNATKHERKIIRQLSGKRTLEQIAEFLGRSRSFIYCQQRKLHCQRKHEPTENDKREIIRLYREWKGQARIAKLTGVPQAAVRRTLLEAGVPIHKTGEPRFQMPPELFKRFRADVLARKHFAIDLAEKYGITKHIALRLSKEILGVPTFFRGALYPPLSSVFPERHDARLTTADYCRFLVRIFPNGVPERPVWELVPEVVSMLLEKYAFWRAADTSVLENLENLLVAALGTMSGSEQTSLVN